MPEQPDNTLRIRIPVNGVLTYDVKMKKDGTAAVVRFRKHMAGDIAVEVVDQRNAEALAEAFTEAAALLKPAKKKGKK